MKTTGKLILAVALSTLLNNCGKSINADAIKNNSSSNPNLTVDSTRGGAVSGNTPQRQCPNVLNNADSNGLEEFLNTSVDNIEGPVTYCLEIDGSGASAKVKFRIEWEDDIGLRRYPDYYANSSTNNDRMQLLYINDDSANTEIILMDIEGFILIKGALNGGTNKFEGNLSFVDIVPYQRDSNGVLLTDSNGQLIFDPSPAGPWSQCRDSYYTDGGGAHLAGHYNNGGSIEPCVTAFNVPHSIFGYNFNYTPSGEFTPTAITAAGNGYTNTQRANLVGMAQQMLNVGNKAALEALNVYQAYMGELLNDPL
ncbi:hypothetical protein GW915_02820 [bacterium]|nr:hypothetical protein [bacterium]